MQPASLTAQNTARPAPDRAAAPRPLRSPQARLNAHQISTERARATIRSGAIALAVYAGSLLAFALVTLAVTHAAHLATLGLPETLAQAERMRGM